MGLKQYEIEGNYKEDITRIVSKIKEYREKDKDQKKTIE